MLLGKKRRRREHYYLPAVHYRFEHRPECDFGLAESDVAAKEPVHWLFGFHVCFYLVYSAELVVSLNIWEFIFEELLLLFVRSARKAFIYASCGVDLKKVVSDFLDCLARETDFFHSSPPSLESFGSFSPGPTYFCSESRFSGRI